jgi:hypothetical protein
VIITCPDPTHKYHRGADSDNKIKKGSNGGSVSNLVDQSSEQNAANVPKDNDDFYKFK